MRNASTRKRRRTAGLILGLLGVGTATALSLTAFQDNLLFFYSPTELKDQNLGADERFRIGGLVAEGSITGENGSTTKQFVVTDTLNDVPVVYNGVLPDLFREGQGVVANGRLNGEGIFEADEVLARHDENYMPPEAKEALDSAEAIRSRAKDSLTNAGSAE